MSVFYVFPLDIICSRNAKPAIRSVGFEFALHEQRFLCISPIGNRSSPLTVFLPPLSAWPLRPLTRDSIPTLITSSSRSEISATLEQQTIDLAEFEYRNSAKLKKKSPIWLGLTV